MNFKHSLRAYRRTVLFRLLVEPLQRLVKVETSDFLENLPGLAFHRERIAHGKAVIDWQAKDRPIDRKLKGADFVWRLAPDQ